MKLYLTKKGKYMLLLSIIFLMIQIATKCEIKNKIQEIESRTFSEKTYMAKITKVIDGDTAEIIFIKNVPEDCSITEKIRFIGINTPELNTHNSKPAEYYAEEAFKFTNKELLNQYVTIQFDPISARKDKYGRIIGYIWIDDFLFNQILVERGFARYYPNFKFDPKYMNLFRQAENYAQTNKMGLWNRQ